MDIWIGRNGERHGPYKEADVRQWLRSGEMAGDDLGWHDGLADWQPLSMLFPEQVNRPAAATPPPMAAAPLPPTTTVALENYAGFWKRFLAYMIDGFVLYIPDLLIMKAMGGEVGGDQLASAVKVAAGDLGMILQAYIQYLNANASTSLVTGLVAWLYFALCESSTWQGTLGKLALGIRVTDLHGARISVPRALGRYPAKFLSVFTLGFGFLMAGWTRRKQALHDMVASTLVLNGRATEFQRSDTPQQRGTPGRFDA